MSFIHICLLSYFFTLLMFPGSAYAQNGNSTSEVDTIKAIFENYLKLSDLSNRVEKIELIQEQIQKTVDDNKGYFEKQLGKTKKEVEIKIGTTFDEIQSLEIENIKKKIIANAKFSQSANTALNAIKNALGTTDYLNEVNALSAITNDDLGFSLESAIVSLTEKHISDKIKEKEAEKVNSFVKKVINNPVIQIAKGVFPVISTVTDFISNISFGSKQIGVSEFNNFVGDLSRYGRHYEKLDDATIEYSNSIAQLQNRSEALSDIVRNFIRERAEIVNPKAELDSVSTNDLLLSIYNESLIDVYIERVSKNSKSYSMVLDSLLRIHPSITNNQAQFIKDEIEYISKQYSVALASYQKELVSIIKSSESLIIGDVEAGKAKSKNKIDVLASKHQKASATFKESVNFKAVELNFKKLFN